MSLMQVVYRPEVHPSQAHHPPEFLVMVEEEAYKKWKADHGSVPLVEVLASSKDPVAVISHGQTGLRTKPSKQELSDNLGSEDPFKAAEFVLLHGKLCKLSDMKTSNKDFFSKD
jgi:ribosome maturation protein Sdo1